MLVLYRKYRPQKFSDVVGQAHIVQTLTNALRYNMVGHAYLFAGPRGTGKTTIARILAKALNCLERKEGAAEPCCACELCNEITKGNAIDLVEIDAASNRGVDEIRELREGIRFLPLKAKYKVFIIDESHMLTKEASNALLKTLEEPPSHAVFILATTDPQKMIPTIASRCQRFEFRRLQVSEIAKRLQYLAKQEHMRVEPEACEFIAFQSGGSLRDAESMLGQMMNFCDGIVCLKDVQNILGAADINEIADFVDLLLNQKIETVLSRIQEFVENGYDPQQFLKTMLSYTRQMLLAKIDQSLFSPQIIVLTKEQKERLLNQVGSLSEQNVKRITEILLEAGDTMRYASLPQVSLEIAAIEIAEVLKNETLKTEKV